MPSYIPPDLTSMCRLLSQVSFFLLAEYMACPVFSRDRFQTDSTKLFNNALHDFTGGLEGAPGIPFYVPTIEVYAPFRSECGTVVSILDPEVRKLRVHVEEVEGLLDNARSALEAMLESAAEREAEKSAKALKDAGQIIQKRQREEVRIAAIELAVKKGLLGASYARMLNPVLRRTLSPPTLGAVSSGGPFLGGMHCLSASNIGPPGIPRMIVMNTDEMESSITRMPNVVSPDTPVVFGVLKRQVITPQQKKRVAEEYTKRYSNT